MQHIAIIYFSKSGVTRQLAESVIKGAQETPDTTIFEYQISGEEITKGRFKKDMLFARLKDADAIVFGSPTYMGSASAQFKAFADASSETWAEQGWSGKLAAGFTCGSAVNGEQTSTLAYFMTLASQHGMLWVGLDGATGYSDNGLNRLGCSLGLVAHAPSNKVHETDIATARYLGQRVATIARRFCTGRDEPVTLDPVA